MINHNVVNVRQRARLCEEQRDEAIQGFRHPNILDCFTYVRNDGREADTVVCPCSDLAYFKSLTSRLPMEAKAHRQAVLLCLGLQLPQKKGILIL